MILLCCGQISQKHFDSLLLFALQLENRGHQVVIDDRFLPNELSKQITYEMAPVLAEFADIEPSCVIVIGADVMTEDVQLILGSMRLEATIPIWVLGNFRDLQAEINARNKIAYATGHEPQVLDLAAHGKPSLLDGAIVPFFAEITETQAQPDRDMSKVLIYLPGKDLEENDTILSHLAGLNYKPNVKLHLMTSAKGKGLIRDSRHAGFSVFSYGELPPCDLLQYFDILVVFGKNVPGERMAALALNAMGAGKVVIDCTTLSGFASIGAPVLRGPEDPAALPGYLIDTVFQNQAELGRRVQQSNWLRQFDIVALERALHLDHIPRMPPKDARQTVFFPTNGNGLGHAQRCALIAAELDPDCDKRFVAFPSCIEMLQKRGFSSVPMVPRSADHSKEYAADLLNYLRLRQIVNQGDQLVFDGGYVFDSVYRLISNLRCPAIWIRRGLWQQGQINAISLERERAFSKVIVPTEAFAELNADYSSGDHIAKVGPIVLHGKLSAEDIESLRDRLSVQFDQVIDTLVVTMLGGGIASERTAQTQLLCSMLERRSNCLHLVVAWPNAVVSNSLYGWENSHVIRTAHTLNLCQAADLTVSAAGYNSFHELLFAHVPAILIPQSAPYLDDQERRALAAFERGLAGFVQEHELLNLDREVSAFLDDGKAETVRDALREVVLPETGNTTAAKLIEENRAQ